MLNPELKTHGFTIKAHRINYPSNSTSIQKEVIDYCNYLQEKWLTEKVYPIFESYKKANIIDCCYTIE